MPASFVEHRPHATSEHAKTSHYVVVINEKSMAHTILKKKRKTQHAIAVTTQYTLQGNVICRTALNQRIGVKTPVKLYSQLFFG